MPNKFSNFDIKSMRPKKLGLDLPHPEIIKEKILPVAKQIRRPKVLLQLISFALVAIILVSILQGGSYVSSAKKASGEILGAATSAYSDLNNASKDLTQQNFAQAKELFESASSNVKIAQDKLNDFKPLTWIAPQANSADHILNGASYLAAAGAKLTSALDLFNEIKVSSKGVETTDFETKLTTNRQVLTESRDLVDQSKAEFDQAQSIPTDYEQTLQKAKNQVGQLSMVLSKLIGLESLYLNIFGGQKTYLLIFQNYDEERATGGFIGTYGVLKTNHGQIAKLKITSIYDLDGQINDLIAAPGPFQPDIKRWGIRDSNWFADFPTSAQKLLYFFEKGDETADGVISTTPKIFEDLLSMVGSIEMPDYGVTLTAENFQEVVQYETSVVYDRKLNQPKKMLADFAPLLLDKLKDLPKEQWLNLLQSLQNNLNQRQVLIYSKDLATEKVIDDLGFSGKLLSTDYDYLDIVNTNLGGTKTDLKMDQDVKLQSKLLSDGSIINTLTIQRTNSNEQNNKDYMRILVPLGSQFVSATGFDDTPQLPSQSEGLRTDPDLARWDVGELRNNVFIRQETGKTEFAGWLNVDGAQQKTVSVTYLLPFKINSAYSLLLQKQSGSKPYNFEGNLEVGKNSVNWTTSGVTINQNGLNFKSNSNTDDFWGFVINK